jgi:hypothetical protein
VEALIVKHAPLLIEYEPEALVGLLIHKPRLKASQLLPAMFRYCSLLDRLHADDKANGVSSTLYDSALQ